MEAEGAPAVGEHTHRRRRSSLLSTADDQAAAQEAVDPRKKLKRLLGGATVLLIVCCYLRWGHLLTIDALQENQKWLRHFSADAPLSSAAIFITLMMGIVALSLPGSTLFCFVSGLAFPQPFACVLAWLGFSFGSGLCYILVQTVLGDYFRGKLAASEKMSHYYGLFRGCARASQIPAPQLPAPLTLGGAVVDRPARPQPLAGDPDDLHPLPALHPALVHERREPADRRAVLPLPLDHDALVHPGHRALHLRRRRLGHGLRGAGAGGGGGRGGG